MTKYHQIRWRESDYLELGRAVKNFNAKITRIIKKNPQMSGVLPDKISYAEMRNLISTRQDYKRELNALRRFTMRGAEEVVILPDNEYNTKITKWQRTEIKRRVAIINRRRKSRLDEIVELDATSRGQGLGYKIGEIGMGSETENTLKPMRSFTKSMSRKDLLMKWKSVLEEGQSNYFTKRDYLLRENYIKGLEQTFKKRDIKEVISAIKEMDIKEFLKIFYQEGGTFGDIYPPNKEQNKAYVSSLKATWIPNTE